MKNICTIIFLSLLSVQANSIAQTDTLFYKWIPQAVAGLNISQIALSNWTQGGEDALTWTVVGNGGLKYQTEVWNFNNDLKVAYGRTKLGTQEFRTNDNEFYLESVLSRNIGWAVAPYISNTVRTAIAAGYDYDTEPKTEIANFFDPGYLTQSIGFIYDKTEGFTTRLGLAVQEVITNKFRHYSDPADSIKKFKVETGIESVSTAEYTMMENVLLKSKLRLFSRFESFDIWDVRWDNAIVMQVNDYLNVNFTVLLIYEEAQVKKRQIKQALQLGLVFVLF